MKDRLAFLFVILSLGNMGTGFAQTKSICDHFKGPGQETKLANCKRILTQGLIPNQKAFNYTVNYLVTNQDGLRYPQCAVSGIDPADDFCKSCRDPNWVKSGFENQCSFIINDLERPWEKNSTRTTGYYVDLCAADPTQIVTSFYFNVGKGLKYDDSPDYSKEIGGDINKSTLAGAFKLEPKVHDSFEPYNPKAYQGIKDRNNGKLYYLGLIGLNSSNNTTDAFKPMHVSPLKSSWGCPSVSEATTKDFGRMIERGSTLYMAYAGERFEEKGSCFNEAANQESQHPTKQSGSVQ